MMEKLRMNEVRRLFYIDLLIKKAMKEDIFDI